MFFRVMQEGKSVGDLVNKHKWTFLILAVLGSALYAYLQRIPLPSDEELIASFQANRTDIEELVRRYRTFDPEGIQPQHLWAKQADAQELLHRAGVRHIGDTALGLWFPDPYAPENDKKAQSLIGERSIRLHHQIGVLSVTLSDPRYKQISLPHGGVIWKDLFFLPEVPRIDNGNLIGPTFYGRPQYQMLVLPSLNVRPSGWNSTSKNACVLRKIESNWFIRLCRAR